MMSTLLASLALLRAVRTDRAAGRTGATVLRWLVYAGLLTFCGYLHELSLFLLAAAHGVTLVWAWVGPRRLLGWLVSVVVAATLVLPLVLLSIREDRAVGVLPVPGGRSVTALTTVLLGSSGTVVTVLGVLAVAGAVAGQVPYGTGLPRRLTLPAFAVPLLVVPPALLMAESRVGKSLWDDRYVLFVLPGAMLLAAAGVGAVARLFLRVPLHQAAWLPVVVVLGLTAVLQWSQQQWLRTPDSRPWNLIAAADYLHRHARPGDGVDYVPRDYNYLPEVYPWAVTEVRQFRLRASPAASGTLHGLPRHGKVLRSAMLTHDRVWVVGDPAGPGHPGKRLGYLYQRHYTLRSTHRFRGVPVLLYVRTSA
jgi:mannosyltransferase